MLRTRVSLLVLLALNGAAYSDTPPGPTANVRLPLFTRVHSDSSLLSSVASRGASHVPVAVACCKVCSVGKACGNTCISRDKTCHVGPGCACDG
jgi:hypothetical protein